MAQKSLLHKFKKWQSTRMRAFTRTLLANPKTMRLSLNMWTPMWASGIKFTDWAKDSSYGRLELQLRWWNQNMHGAAFGGTLFAMTDVAFGTLAARYFEGEFEVWTRTGTFQFLSPGRDGAYLEVSISPEYAEWIRSTVAEDGYANVPYTSVIKNKDGSIVGIGQQDLHVRPWGGGKRAERPQQALQPRGLVLEHLASAVVWHCFKEQPELLTIIMSEQRRIPLPEDQMRLVLRRALEKSSRSREDLLALDIPEHFIAEAEAALAREA